MGKQFFFLIPGFLILAGAFGVQAWDSFFHPAEITKNAPLSELIPAEIKGWESEDLPLAETESVEDVALRRLNFNDYLYRAYRRGDTRVSVYIAYWEPLQMPVRQVGSHTPDVCWVLNGWECETIKSDVSFALGEGRLKPAEDRVFTAEGITEYVIYWHLIQGKAYRPPNEIGMWDRWNMLTDHFRFGLNQKPEQYFVRISSNKPFDTFWDSSAFENLMREVAQAVELKVPEGDRPEDWKLDFAI
mgnify:FL=1